MLVRVMYQDYRYDYVDTHTLDKLITFKSIKKFLRQSEDRWVDIVRDPIRGMGGNYSGSERRQAQVAA
jgi:hypothetical protein